MISHTELAWAAGHHDGEGNVSVHSTGGGRWKYPRVCISSTDQCHLERYHSATLQIGKIYGPYEPTGRSGHRIKPIWFYTAHGWERTIAVVSLLWKYLSEPKRDQAVRVFKECREARQ